MDEQRVWEGDEFGLLVRCAAPLWAFVLFVVLVLAVR